MIKATPVSGTHIRAAASEIRDIFKALLSTDFSRKIIFVFWRGKVKHATRLAA
jgi:hypothetical protein